MATLYTNLYGEKSGVSTAAGALTTTKSYIYNGPSGQQKGDPTVRVATYTGLIANGDVLKIAGGFLGGERVVSIAGGLTADADTGNDITFNLGSTTAPAGILSGSTGLQAVTGFSVTANSLASTTFAFVAGDDLILTATNGTETSVTFTFVVTTAF